MEIWGEGEEYLYIQQMFIDFPSATYRLLELKRKEQESQEIRLERISKGLGLWIKFVSYRKVKWQLMVEHSLN